MTGPRFRLGVDFGTTHTVAALSFPDGRVQPLLFESNPLLPSAVFADPSGRLLVGRDAERSSRVDPARYEPNPKRRIDEGSVLLGDAEYRISGLVAAVLRRVYEEAVRVAGRPPSGTVLTHPADWAATRLATLTEAAAQAGIGAVTLVPEPLAAAAYFSGMLRNRVPPGSALLVYDFGGGTFDISVIRRRADDGWDVLATEGLDDVGGLDLDAALVDRIGAGLAATDPVRWQRLVTAGAPDEQRRRRLLWDEVRAAKEQLSRTAVAVVHVPLFDADVHVTREEFEQLARPWLERTVALTAATLFRTGLSREQLAGVVLVGGSTRIPMVGTLLHQRLGMAPTVLDQPELVVAQGALAVGGAAAGADPTLPLAVPPTSAPPTSAPPVGPQPVGPQAAAMAAPSMSTYAAPPPPAAAGMPGYAAAGMPGYAAAGGYPSPPGGTRHGAKSGPRRPPRRRSGVVLAVAAIITLAVVISALLLPKFLDDDDDPGANRNSSIKVQGTPGGRLTDQPSPPATVAPTATATETAAGAGTKVRYEIEASGSGNTGDVEYTDKNGDIIRLRGIKLPWSLTFTTEDPNHIAVLIGQRTGGGNSGPVTCRITVNGKVTDQATQRGRYAAPQC